MIENTTSAPELNNLDRDLSATAEHHLAEVLSSDAFRMSERSRRFLTHVVRESLAGRSENLKERVIGEQVFSRAADYDTGQDSIVRVKANEVRRRLSQFYEHHHPESPVRFEMSAGSYAVRIQRHRSAPLAAVVEPLTGGPVFVQAESSSSAPLLPAPSEPWSWTRVTWVAGLAILVSAAVLVPHFWSPFAVSSATRFWAPFLQGSSPLLVCVPAPDVYRIYGTRAGELVHAFKPRSPEDAAARGPVNVSLRDAKVVPEPGLFVGIGDAHVISTLSSIAAAKGKPFVWRASSLTTFADISSHPSVVIGAETNPWHKDLRKGSRYTIARFEGRNSVVDEKDQQALCVKPATWEPASNYDCGVLTRLPNGFASSTSQPLLLVGGLDHLGTYALGDLISNSKFLEAALARAPAGWESRNLEIVVRVERLGNGGSPPQTLAVNVW